MEAAIKEQKRSAAEPGKPSKPARRPRRRMAAEDREVEIVRHATAYFAEHGLSAGTIKLARRIGITQPLLYKYFPTKDALIDKVYEQLLPQNWDPTWESLIEDETIPLPIRLKKFYTGYVTSVLTYEHVRLFLFSGLGRNEFNARCYAILSKRIFERIALALRREYGPPSDSPSVQKSDLELVQSLHAVMYHLAYRRYVHQEPMPDDLSELVSLKVDTFLYGAVNALSGAQRDQASELPR